MANTKEMKTYHSDTALNVYCVVKREADGFLLNDADGAFASAPADPFLALSEHVTIKGLYEVSENRTVWNDGRYTVLFYSRPGGSPVPSTDDKIGSGEMIIENDLEVYLDKLPSFIHKWILNRLVITPAAVTLYDDDNVTALKTWSWDEAAKTRSKAV